MFDDLLDDLLGGRRRRSRGGGLRGMIGRAIGGNDGSRDDDRRDPTAHDERPEHGQPRRDKKRRLSELLDAD